MWKIHREEKKSQQNIEQRYARSGLDRPTECVSAYITVNVSDIGVFLYDLLLCLWPSKIISVEQ